MEAKTLGRDMSSRFKQRKSKHMLKTNELKLSQNLMNEKKNHENNKLLIV